VTRIRRATLQDVGAIIELAVESVSIHPEPVVIDRAGMLETARQVVGHPSHFCWVAEDDDGIQACVAAVVQKGFWFRGTQASVLLFYARKPGAGWRLLVEFSRWVKSRSAIKFAVFELEPQADPRIAAALRRLGFGRQSINCAYVREKGTS
jgi:hypothetical protein